MMADKLFTKRLRELTDEAIRESLAEISVEFEKRFGPVAWNTRATQPLSLTVDWPADAEFRLGDTVQKKGRASWRGHVRGWYRTDLTALGYAVESMYEPGSVQIYPASALDRLQSLSLPVED